MEKIQLRWEMNCSQARCIGDEDFLYTVWYIFDDLQMTTAVNTNGMGVKGNIL